MAKKKQHFYGDQPRDSQEEVEFNAWLDEAKFAGLVESYQYQPEPYVITPDKTYTETSYKTMKDGSIRVIKKEKHLLRKHSYQADFKITFTDKFFQMFPDSGLMNFSESKEYIVDVKGSFDRNKSLRIFSIDKKLVWHTFNVWVNKIVPAEWFKKTFVPLSCAFIKNRKDLTVRKPYQACRLLADVNS